MPYATAADLLGYLGAKELAERGAPEDRRVTPELMRLTITGGDRSAYAADVQAAADGAAARIAEALASASSRIDSYLAPRYPLPLDAALVGASDLKQVCMDLARSRLYSRLPEEVKEQYERQVAWLRDLAAGRASLGPQDTAVATPEGRVALRPGASAHDWDSY